MVTSSTRMSDGTTKRSTLMGSSGFPTSERETHPWTATFENSPCGTTETVSLPKDVSVAGPAAPAGRAAHTKATSSQYARCLGVIVLFSFLTRWVSRAHHRQLQDRGLMTTTPDPGVARNDKA